MTNSAERSEAKTMLSIALEAVELGERQTPGPWSTTPPKWDGEGFAPGVLIAATAPGKSNRVYADPPGGSFPGNDLALIAHAGTHYAALARAYVGVVGALQNIKDATNADDPESYRADDREGCLDTVFAIASRALTKENTDG